MFVEDAAVDPLPELVKSSSRHTFEAYVIANDHPMAIALHDAGDEVCKDSDRPGRKSKQSGAI
jgi:hypothetical protein